MVNLDNLISSSKFFIDTCSFMHEQSEMFLIRMLPSVLVRYSKRIIVPEKVAKEIEILRKNNDYYTRRAAERGAKILSTYIKQKLVDVRGEAGDPFADGLFQYVFMKFRIRYNLTLLTQDADLATDIMNISASKSVQSRKKIVVLRLNGHGDLMDWQDYLRGQKKKSLPRNLLKIQRFRKCSVAAPQNERRINVTNVPDQGDVVNSQKLGSVRLVKKISEGGEGKIFTTTSGDICKVYHREKISDYKLKKLTLMINNSVNISEVCWPLEIARNNKNEFIGYIMPKAEGIPMQKSMFIKPLLNQNFSYWRREHLVTLAINILEKMKSLHDRNVLIGDINPFNILIKSETQVYFVDTDSYQIEDFPCPVGMANFTAPEIQGKDYGSFLRTLEHEYFAIATLLFMVLLPGKPPFSHQGGGDPISNIKKGVFSYPFEEKSNKKVPEGSWRFIWSHLPYKTKKAFYNCFASGKRPTLQEWLKLMNHYKTTLNYGHLTNDIFPSNLKPVSEYARVEYGAR